jgi:DNA-binding LacI/PurR family transcriptional regulator
MFMDRITIADVAKRAGVSISTVSYAISNKRPISDETQQRIQQAIEDLGFHPNQSAKRLASKEKTRNIGFVLPLQGSELTGLEMKFISGAAKVINQADYTFILLAHSDRDPENLLRFARNGMVDGFILMEVYMHDERVELLKDVGLPFVLIGRCADNTGLTYVDIDIEKGMEFFFNHFISHGHEKVACLIKEDTNLGLNVRSLQEFQSACQRYNIVPLLQPCSLSTNDGEKAMHILLDKQPDLNACLIWNEIPAIGAARAVQARGRRIPEDFSIICLAQSAIPNLTNFTPIIIDIRAEEAASRAAELMIAMLEGRSMDETQVLITPQLISTME